VKPLYHVILINLAPDARSFAALSHIERRDVTTEELLLLLRNFCEVDPVENTSADAEIRVQVRRESYLLRTEQKKLILYDVHHRDLPAQMFTLEEVMAELDGTAAATRNQSVQVARAGFEPVGETLPVPELAPPAVASKPRLIVLSFTAVVLLAGIILLAGPFGRDVRPEGFVPLEPAERGGLEAKLAGVYLTGNEPGQHGIVVTSPRELKLFELGAVEAPRVVYVAYQLGRLDGKLCLATDQPGGVIEVTARGGLSYCGEIYQRIP